MTLLTWMGALTVFVYLRGLPAPGLRRTLHGLRLRRACLPEIKESKLSFFDTAH